jgi:pilus assembly protein FimV
MKLNRIASQLAASALLLVLPLGAYSAGLGRLTVNSALGQPLSAEIELLAVDKAELDSLNASLAAGQAFKDAQIEYAPVLSTLKFAVDRKQDGRPVLKITSTRPVNDPFLDMLIELNWASGRLVREYTVLLDPPGVATTQIVAPVMVTAPVAQAPKAATPSPEPKQEPFPAAKPLPVAQAPGKPEDKAAVEPKEAAAEKRPAQQPVRTDMAAPAPDQVRVKRGDTLAGIAMRVKPANISLDQALVSLFNENTKAFVGKNMNRLKAGKTLTVPSEDAMAAVDEKSATREVRLQASDWHIYRTKLAERVAATSPAEPAEKGGQISAGKITPKVEDKAQPAKEVKDVLKLSKSALPPPASTASAVGKGTKEDAAAKDKAAMQEKAKAEAEDLTAREKALKESADRVATLEKQIQDMHELAQMNEKAQAGAETPPAPAPKIEAKPPIEPLQANWYQQILENPLYWGGGLAALGLGGALWWMMTGNRRRKSTTQQFEDSLMSSQGLSPNTVIGAASGGAVNTGDTSFLTDFSQAGLGTIDTHDVDPIAEAEVYMAYGRDAQAEEILKEALNKTPDRHEIRVKLLEIYAARKNTAAFGAVAKDLHDALGHTHSPIWERAAEMGRSIDPGNPLYGGATARRGEGTSVATDEAGAVVAGAMGVAAASGAVAEAVNEMPPAPAMDTVEPAPPTAFETAGEVLDFDQEIARQNTPAAVAPAQANTQHREEAARERVAEAAAVSSKADLDHGLEFDLSGLDIKLPEEDEGDFSMDEVDALSADGKMDFSGLDLNLDQMGGEGDMDEVATKLDLARAYLEMGDKEGAREILQEVLNEGNDRQQNDARSMMAGL